MNRVAFSVASIAVLFGAVAASAAPPVTVNGGPTPDRTVVAGCAGESPNIVTYNGGPMTAPEPPATLPAGAKGLSTAPVGVNGGQTPSPIQQAAKGAAGWCGGAYRPDMGSNFAGTQ